MLALDFLLDTLSHFVKLDDSPPPGVPAHAGSGFERDLMRLCDRQRLSPIVIHSLDRLVLPSELSRITLEHLKESRRRISKQNNRLAQKLTHATGALRRKGIPFMTAGVTAASSLYPVPDLRAVEGIDLLVRESDWPGILECMGVIGFEPLIGTSGAMTADELLRFHQYYAPCVFRDEEGDEIRLSFRIFAYGPPDVEEKAWSRAREAARLPEAKQALGLEDQLIRSAIELNARAFSDFLLVTDIGLLLANFTDQIDWIYFQERLRSQGLYGSAYFSIKHAANLLKLPWSGFSLRHPGRIREEVFEVIWGTRRVDYFAPRKRRRRYLKYHLLECRRFDKRLTPLRKILSPEPALVAAFFDRPDSPKLRLSYILRAITGRWVGSAGPKQAGQSVRSLKHSRHLPEK